jgi:Tol biopolymer transport system component
MRRALVLALAALACAPAAAGAKSTDSLAPAHAPPHWLPPEPWVYNHWLPYDEGRLYRLLRADRAAVWQQLRDDRRNLAQLGRRRGWRSTGRLADALVAPWRGRVPASRLRTLRERALRTLTQGHLAQHVLFHSLHQFAIPSEAPVIFGLPDAEFRAMRRSELSPLDIGALHGRSPAQIQAACIRVLRERALAGVSGKATTARQARMLLRRQISQLPRWLGQARYNGPPKTHRGALVETPRDYASNPAISADGRHVAYEAYRQKLPNALRFGEITVVSRELATGAQRLVSPPNAPAADGAVRPSSAYNPTVSGDGAVVAYESSAGNQNFAKRYGRIDVFAAGADGVSAVERDGVQARASQSAYNPVLAADGRHLLFQAVAPDGLAGVYVRDLATGTTARADAGIPDRPRDGYRDVLEPDLSADGRVAVFTVLRGTLSRRGTVAVYARDLARRTTTLVGAGSDPAVSGDGRWVAYVSAQTRRLTLRDLQTGAARAVGIPADGTVLDPQLSGDGRVVAFTAVSEGRRRVLVRDAENGATTLASRADGENGATAVGDAGDPALSADGRLVAFASDAANLDPAKRDRTRGVFVRDLQAQTTALVSDTSAAAAPVASAAAAGPTITVRDNEFLRGDRARPTVRVRRGTLLTWRWRGQESHNVTVRSGPARFRSPTRTRGTLRRRLTARGSYRIVCTLHAPGMRMRVVVR